MHVAAPALSTQILIVGLELADRWTQLGIARVHGVGACAGALVLSGRASFSVTGEGGAG